ncbi:hypothetical protein CVT26_008484 [Gymnopilus dilepis]|uniref:Uncharacterized protein n=1 Tax=Gymnopilus dilepis TaxID=231916 RepID=A0A409XXK6_9AGAR|nr:hypothetical protein CVT26_008484 [Gymnopilus dilepis]
MHQRGGASWFFASRLRGVDQIAPAFSSTMLSLARRQHRPLFQLITCQQTLPDSRFSAAANTATAIPIFVELAEAENGSLIANRWVRLHDRLIFSSSLVSSEATPQPDMVLAVSSKMTRTADTIDVGGVGSIIGSNTTVVYPDPPGMPFLCMFSLRMLLDELSLLIVHVHKKEKEYSISRNEVLLLNTPQRRRFSLFRPTPDFKSNMLASSVIASLMNQLNYGSCKVKL